MIIVENKGNKIEIFGRDKEGRPFKKINDRFRPYFWVESKFGNMDTIDRKKARKVVVEHPREIYLERQKYTRHYEADVRYPNRYIIDNYDKIEECTIRVCYLDIETDGASDPNKADKAITVIGVYDNFNKKHKQFILNDFKKRGESEVDLLSSFIQYIQMTDPDILVAWYGHGFDFPYILNRMKKLGININRLSRGGYSYTGKKTKIYGRILFDMLEAYKIHFSSGGRESYSLDYISKYELGEKGGKTEYDGSLEDLYTQDYKKYIEYNKRDVELLILLDKHLKMVDFYDEIRRMAFCNFDDVNMASKITDCLCLKYAMEQGIVLPSTVSNGGDTYEGGYVMQSIPKLYKNIAVFDFKSLYPSIMVTFNTSYETIDQKNGEINIDDKYKFTKIPGIIPSLVKPLLYRRDEIKNNMKQLNPNSLEYRSLDITQKAVKVLANAFYGVMGYKRFRLYNRDVASAITYIARRVLKESVDWFNNRGYNVIYTDTDSCFIEMNGKSKEEIKKLGYEINQHFFEWMKRFNIDPKNNIFKLEFEKMFRTLFFKQKNDGTGAKKKYAGKVVVDGGPDQLEIVGFESNRSDSPQICRDFVTNILDMILEGKPESEVKQYVDKFKHEIRNDKYSPEELGLPVSINKPLEEYGNVMHIRASRLANKRHDEGIRHGDKVKYLYIIDPEDNVIAFKDKCPEGYEIDYDNMIRRIVDLKIETIFDSLNWTYKRSKKTSKRLKNSSRHTPGDNSTLSKWINDHNTLKS